MNLHPLPEDRLHIWRINLERGRSSLDYYRAVLATCELGRASRFHFRTQLERYIVAHGVLRYVLALYAGCRPTDVPISTSDSGKPVLTDSAFEFSLSHSETLAVVAIARRQVGIDIERVRPVPDAISLATRFFSRSEAGFISGFPGTSLDLEFLRLWTRKEAFLKGCGLGLSGLGQLARFAKNEWNSNQFTSCDAIEGTGLWGISEVEVEPSYLGAVAVKGSFDKLEQFSWN
jgi:4'-phosphopantetheinyl transferase